MKDGKKVKKYQFSGKVINCVYNSENFKIYAFDIDQKKYPYIRQNKYKNVSILGELPNLTIGNEYEIVAVEHESKYGIGYKVINIKRLDINNYEDMRIFLAEILTDKQTQVLWEHYPDIVQRVRENRLDDIDLSKLKGIKEYTFNLIKQKIIDNFCLADLVVEFQGYLSMSVIKKLYDKYSSIEVLKKKLQTDPYKCLCGLSGVGFKTADSILLAIEKVSNENVVKGKPPIINFSEELVASPERCLACLLYLLSENESEGHTKMNLADLRSECIKIVPACVDHFGDVIKSKEIYYNKETMDVSLSKTYDTEKYIADTILKYIDNKNNVWDFDTKKYQSIGSLTLSEEQMSILDIVCKNQICILNGSAGCGKSCSTQAIIEMLKDNHKSFKLFTPTGKSAKVISNFTHEKASTIHRGLQYNPSDPDEITYVDDTGKTITELTRWGLNKAYKLECDILIIDEFSMVDVFLFSKVIDALDLTKTKLLLIGDNCQLPSVGCGNLLHDFMKSNIIPSVTLTKVFRYGEGGLMKVATDVRKSQIYLNNSMKSRATVFGNNKDYIFVDLASESIPAQTVALYKKLLDKGNTIENIQVLTAKNVGDCGTAALNNLLQKVANKNYGSDVKLQVGETIYYESDLVIQKANNYKAKLDPNHLLDNMESIESNKISFDLETQMLGLKPDKEPTAFVANGESGIIKEIYNSYAVIDFSGIYVKYSKSEMTDVKLGYAITIHSSQGSSIDNVILCTPQSHIFMLNNNLLYTGLTRMKNKCYHLGTLTSVNQAIKKKANLQRNTFMQKLLKE